MIDEFAWRPNYNVRIIIQQLNLAVNVKTTHDHCSF